MHDEPPSRDAGTRRGLAWPLAAIAVGGIVVIVLVGGFLVRQSQPGPRVEPAAAVTAPAATSAPTQAPVAAVAPTAPATAVPAATVAPTSVPTQAPLATATPAPVEAAGAATQPTVIATIQVLYVKGTPVVEQAVPTVGAAQEWWNRRGDVAPEVWDDVIKACIDIENRAAQARYQMDPSRLAEVEDGAQLQREIDLINTRKASGQTLKTEADHTYMVLWANQNEAVVYDDLISRSHLVDTRTNQEIPTDNPSTPYKNVLLLHRIDGHWKFVDGVQLPS